MQSEYQQFFGKGFMLETPRVVVRLMKPEDIINLQPLTASPDIWTWFKEDLSKAGELEKWMQDAFAGQKAETRVPFVIIEKDTGLLCGCTSYLNFSFPDKRIEIGGTWLGAAYQGREVNRHTKFALLSFAFEALKMQRIEIKTDALNERSKAAILKIGMIPEGILRSHMQMHSNRRRDTMYFSILREEWLERKKGFFADMV